MNFVREHPLRGVTDIFDAAAVTADLEALAAVHSGGQRELRTAVAQRLKAAHAAGRAAAAVADQVVDAVRERGRIVKTASRTP